MKGGAGGPVRIVETERKGGAAGTLVPRTVETVGRGGANGMGKSTRAAVETTETGALVTGA